MFLHLTLEYFSWSTRWLQGVRVPWLQNEPKSWFPPLPCLYWYDVFGFCQMWHCVFWSNISTLVRSIQRKLFENSCGLFRCNYANLCCAAVFFYDRRGFLLAVLTNGLYFFSFLRIVLSWTLTFNMPTYTCTVWNVAFGQFSEYYSIWPWGEFAESFTPGRIVALCYHTPDCSMPIKRSNVCFHSSARTCWWSTVHVISSIWQQLLNIVIPVKAAWKRATTTNY